MSSRPPAILWILPFVFTAFIGWFGWYGYRVAIQTPGVEAQLRRYGYEETLRWGGAAGATLVLSLAVVVAMWWPARRPMIRIGKSALMVFLFVYSCMPAYWPEREWIEQGWFVHPSKIAIYGPSISAFLVMGVTAATRALVRRESCQ